MNPNVPEKCTACGKPLLLENLFVDDGCPCNSPRGVNFKPQDCLLCKTDNCVKPGHRIEQLYGLKPVHDKRLSIVNFEHKRDVRMIENGGLKIPVVGHTREYITVSIGATYWRVRVPQGFIAAYSNLFGQL